MEIVRKKLSFLGQSIRVFAEDPIEVVEPFFSVPDLSGALKMNVHMLCAGLSDEDLKSVSPQGGDTLMNVLSAEGVNYCMLRTRAPEARGLRRWMFHTALPLLGTSRGTLRKMEAIKAATEALQTINLAELKAGDRDMLREQVLSLLRSEDVDVSHYSALTRGQPQLENKAKAKKKGN